MRIVSAILCSLVISAIGELATDQKATQVKEEENKLMDEIANIIADDVLLSNKQLQGVTNHTEAAKILKKTASKTLEKLEPRLKELSNLVADPEHTARNIVEIIKQATTSKALQRMAKAEEKDEIHPRFILGSSMTGLAKMASTFVSFVMQQ